MIREMDEFEFTLEDILRMHQGWITKLFVEDRKTELEIVQQLYEGRFVVTVSQIRQCLLEWNLITPAPTMPAPESPSPHRSLEDWDIIPFQSSTPPPPSDRDQSLTPSSLDPKVLELYIRRPLPSLPSTERCKTCSRTQHYPRRVKLKLNSYSKQDTLETETQRTLAIDATSRFEAFVITEEGRERLERLGWSHRNSYTSAGEGTLDSVPRVFQTLTATQRPSQQRRPPTPIRGRDKSEEKEEEEVAKQQ